MRARSPYPLPTHRALRWLVSTSDVVDDDLRQQLLAGPFSSRAALIAGALNCLLITATCAFIQPSGVFIGWMILDTLTWVTRLLVLEGIRRSTGSLPTWTTELLLGLGLFWAIELGLGTAACILSGHPVIQVLGCTSAIAINGAIAIRNQGIPRYAFLQILLIDVPMKLATLFQPEPLLRLLLLQAPLYLMGCWTLLNNLNISLVKALSAEANSDWRASHDDLTGLYNRAGVLARLEGALCQPRSRLKGVALLYLDMDDFKRINDEQGHAAGDRLLQCFAQLLQQNVRQSDFAGRLGGDEFLLVMQDAEEEPALRLAQRIIDQARLQDATAPAVSIGIALQTEADELQTLLARADAALYAAKQAGKGRFALGDA